MAKRMKPVASLEPSQVIEWIMPLRRLFHRIGIACAASHHDAGALHPGQAHCIELMLVESDTARYQRFSGVGYATTAQALSSMACA
jgi:hypothetical protein